MFFHRVVPAVRGASRRNVYRTIRCCARRDRENGAGRDCKRRTMGRFVRRRVLIFRCRAVDVATVAITENPGGIGRLTGELFNVPAAEAGSHDFPPHCDSDGVLFVFSLWRHRSPRPGFRLEHTRAGNTVTVKRFPNDERDPGSPTQGPSGEPRRPRTQLTSDRPSRDRKLGQRYGLIADSLAHVTKRVAMETFFPKTYTAVRSHTRDRNRNGDTLS